MYQMTLTIKQVVIIDSKGIRKFLLVEVYWDVFILADYLLHQFGGLNYFWTMSSAGIFVSGLNLSLKEIYLELGDNRPQYITIFR